MNRKLSKQEFKAVWEREDCDITWDDIANCAVDWGLSRSPRTMQMTSLGNKVLAAVGIESYWEEEEGARRWLK